MHKKQIASMLTICVLLFGTMVVAQQDKKHLTNEDIIKMVKAGLPDDTIVLVIQSSPNKFDTSPDALIALKGAGATKRILDAILQFQDSPTRASRVESPTNPRNLKLGTYSATVTQVDEYLDSKLTSEVKIKIKIDSVDSDGNVTGEFIHSTLKKGGKGGITGKIGDSNKLQLKGYLISQFDDKWQVTLTFTIGDKNLTDGKYRLEAGIRYLTGRFEIAELEEDD